MRYGYLQRTLTQQDIESIVWIGTKKRRVPIISCEESKHFGCCILHLRCSLLRHEKRICILHIWAGNYRRSSDWLIAENIGICTYITSVKVFSDQKIEPMLILFKT